MKFLNLKICFDTNFSDHPLQIELENKKVTLKKGKTFYPFLLTSFKQIDNIEFFGFSPNDTKQKVIVSIFYNDKKLDCSSLMTFQMKNNQYVDNTILKDYYTIYFNGCLKIKFFKEWIECNILKGHSLGNDKKSYIYVVKDYSKKYDRNRNKDLTSYDIICLGASFTHGTDYLEFDQSWPYKLQLLTGVNVGNFGQQGLDQYSILNNAEYVIKHLKVKTIILFLDSVFMLPMRKKFLDTFCFVITRRAFNNNEYKDFIFKKNIDKWLKYNILKEKNIIKLCKKKLENIENICKIDNVNLKIILNWDHDNWYISKNLLPINLSNLTKEQTIHDNHHPNENTYLEFAKKIVKYL